MKELTKQEKIAILKRVLITTKKCGFLCNEICEAEGWNQLGLNERNSMTIKRYMPELYKALGAFIDRDDWCCAIWHIDGTPCYNMLSTNRKKLLTRQQWLTKYIKEYEKDN